MLLDALNVLVVTGTIDASGGDDGTSDCDGGGGGGGSGGWIKLLAGAAIPTFSARSLDVSGGAGDTITFGGTGGDGAAGFIDVGSPPMCMDSRRNQDETDIDCGGTICGACPIRSMCLVDTDCTMGRCPAGFCVGATCTNTTMDGMETDVDCGGPGCLACVDGLMCAADRDCVSMDCDTAVCISCGDGTTNGGETCDDSGESATCDVDCTAVSCGDRVINVSAGESCDDGNMTRGDGCSATCVLEIAASGSSVNFSGSIDATDPVWGRALADCSALTTPVNHNYDVHTITNSTGAAQTLTVTAMWSGDGYIHAFSDPLDLMSIAGCIDGDDDFGGTSGSRMVGVPIADGATIHIIASTFFGMDAIGPYTIEIATD